MEGCVLNLDDSTANITYCVITDDIRSACSVLEVAFDTSVFIAFKPDKSYYFTYFGLDWIPISQQTSISSSGTYHYEICAVPKIAFEIIRSVTDNTFKLATSVGLKLTNNSASLPVKCPLINDILIDTVKFYRKQSLEQKLVEGNLIDSTYIYFTSNGMYSNTWRKILNSESKPLQTYNGVSEQNIINLVYDLPASYLSVPDTHGVWSENDYYTKMMGYKFEITGLTSSYFLNMYNINFDNNNVFDFNKKYLCVYSQYDGINSGKFKNIFAEVLL